MRHMIVTLAALAVFSGNALAAKWTEGIVKVQHILWRPDLKGFYAEPGTYHNPDQCGSASFYQLSDNVGSESERSRILAILLTAKTDGSKLHMWIEGCGSHGPLFTGLQINP